MTNSEMRQFLKTRYNGKYRGTLVDDMPDRQVWCVYNSVKHREESMTNVEVVKEQQVVETPHVLQLDNGDYVIDGEEYLTKEEYESMNR